MTIKQLKEAISNLPDEMQVLVTAYEHGYSTPTILSDVPIFTYEEGEDSDIYGPYITSKDMYFNKPGTKEAFNAFILERGKNNTEDTWE